MKCKATIVYYTKTGKIAHTFPGGLTNTELVKLLQPLGEKRISKLTLLAENGLPFVCQGNIIGEISCHDEPYYGGTSAELDVEYKCDTCGHNFYPYLPHKHNINDWFNKILSEME